MAEEYRSEALESSAECSHCNSPVDEMELYAEEVCEDAEPDSIEQKDDSPPAPDLSWEEKHLPFEVSQPMSDGSRKLWEYYSGPYASDYAPISHQMFEQWHIDFGPMVDAAENVTQSFTATFEEGEQLYAILHSMRRLLDDFWAIWNFTRFMCESDPFIRRRFRKAGLLSEPAAGGAS